MVMKRFCILFILLLSTIVCQAQWKIKYEDDGFDDKSYVAYSMSKDGAAKIHMVTYENDVILFIETPEIVYRSRANDVEITFKINGVNKVCKISGCTSSGSSSLMLTPKDGGMYDIGKLLKDEFLSDFKNASAMKVRVYYSAMYSGYEIKKWEEYVFNMTGSTSAYNKVLKQK